VSLNSWTNCWR